MKTLYSLVGMRHHNTTALLATLPAGEPVSLVREPTNPYDVNAIEVHARGVFLGYIAARENTELARQMDAAAKGLALVFDCRLVPGNSPQIEVDVTQGRAPSGAPNKGER